MLHKSQRTHRRLGQCHLNSVWTAPRAMSHIQGGEDKNKGAGTSRVEGTMGKTERSMCAKLHQMHCMSMSWSYLHSSHFHNRHETPSFLLSTSPLPPLQDTSPLAHSTRAGDARAHSYSLINTFVMQKMQISLTNSLCCCPGLLKYRGADRESDSRLVCGEHLTVKNAE